MNDIRCQDEILQMMYWMRGEQLDDRVTITELNRFLNLDTPSVAAALEQLVARGLVVAEGKRFLLTERGVLEGGRRFLDEFSAMLGKEDHLRCSDPQCECQSADFDGMCKSVVRR